MNFEKSISFFRHKPVMRSHISGKCGKCITGL